MPTVAQSELPRPKAWDEFEDIVWDLYARKWQDPQADRYGRAGQPQHGVDICGRPAYLGGRCAGVQCKRYAEGTLTVGIIEREVAKAEAFVPALAEYTIATTDARDAGLQSFVLALSQEREAAGKFPVHIVFWDTLCGWLTNPENRSILQKHYGEWFLPAVAEPHQVPQVPPISEECLVVAVANFEGPEPERYTVTQAVVNRLRHALEPYDDVVIKPLGRAIGELQGSTVARREGERLGAAIVIWGWYGTPGDVVPVSVNFEVLGSLSSLVDLPEKARGELRLRPAEALRSFQLQTELAAEMTYLTLFMVGLVRYNAADFQGAVTLLTAALSAATTADKSPDVLLVHAYRGAAHLQEGNYEAATEDYDRVIAQDPKFAWAYNNRGIARQAQGDRVRAIEDFSKAIALDPEFVWAYSNRGATRQAQGDRAGAIEDHERAIALDPRDGLAYYNLGCLAALQGEVEEACARLETAIRLEEEWRGVAREDADFDGIRGEARFQRLVEVDGEAGEDAGVSSDEKG